jgi:hypothetical protein
MLKSFARKGKNSPDWLKNHRRQSNEETDVGSSRFVPLFWSCPLLLPCHSSIGRRITESSAAGRLLAYTAMGKINIRDSTATFYVGSERSR